MQDRWISLITTVVVSLITSGLGACGGYFAAKYNYESDVLKYQTELEINKRNSENEIEKNRVEYFISRCEKINTLAREIGASYQEIFVNSLSSDEKTFEANFSRLKIDSQLAGSYFGKEARDAYLESLKTSKESKINEIESKFMAYLVGLNVELEECNKPNSFIK